MTPLVVCVKVGTKYGPEYVNRLAAMVARHMTIPHDFLCLTDNADGLQCDAADIGTTLEGWWAKLILFKPHDRLRDRRVLFMDLDTVIVGNIDFLLEPDEPFVILRDFYRPQEMGSAIMLIDQPYCPEIYSCFPGTHRYWGDQAWIQECVGSVGVWQDLFPGKIVSYKVHCANGLPEQAAVVCFHGEPRPHQVSDPWMLEHWTEQGSCVTTSDRHAA